MIPKDSRGYGTPRQVRVVCLVLLWIMSSFTPCWAQEERVIDGIAAIVNDEIITMSEVREAMALEMEQVTRNYQGRGLDERLQALFQRTLQGLTAIQLQLARARKLQLQVSEEEVDHQINALKAQNQLSDDQLVQLLRSRGMTLEIYRKQVREGLLVSKVINAEVRSRLIVLDTELQEAYQKKLASYKIAGSQTVSHILFLVPQQATADEEEPLRQKAASVLKQLRAGGDFATLAGQYSEGPSAERGGLLGTFKPGELLPGFEEAAAALSPGEMSDLVRTRIGWHIIRVDNRQSDSYRPFEEVQEELKSDILRDKTEGKYEEWLESLRQQSFIKILSNG